MIRVLSAEAKPDPVVAVFFDGLATHEEAGQIATWAGGTFYYDEHTGQEFKRYYWFIKLPDGNLARPGDYIVKDRQGRVRIFPEARFHEHFDIKEEV